MKLAAIDYGTVTTRLLVAEVTEQSVDALLRRTTITHLGEGLAKSGKISLAAQERICAATREYLADIVTVAGDGCPVVAVATSAMRDADNSQEVLAALRELGVNVEIIAGEREAYLSFIGTVNGFDTLDSARIDSEKGSSAGQKTVSKTGTDEDGLEKAELSDAVSTRVLVVDIGGGSTEVILGSVVFAGSSEVEDSFVFAESSAVSGLPAVAESSAGPSTDSATRSTVVKREAQVLASHSFDMGSRRVSDRFLLSDPPTVAEQNQAREWIGQQLTEFFANLESRPEVMIAVAGTATSAISVRERMTVYDPALVHGSVMLVGELAAITNHLAALSEQERQRVVGLEPERASVIVGGLLVLQTILGVCELPSFIVSESDILQGILLDGFKRYHG